MIQRIPVYIGLGSNQGQPEANLARAREQIIATTGLSSALSSAIYYTEPLGVKDQPWFANQVMRVLCHPTWTAGAFIRHLLNIEHLLGRKRQQRWGPRRIDCDLLLFGQESLDTRDLVVPHPRMFERAFVLIPLLELDPDLCFPDGNRADHCLHSLTYRLQGRRIWQEEDLSSEGVSSEAHDMAS